MKFTILVDPSLVIISTYMLGLTAYRYMPGCREEYRLINIAISVYNFHGHTLAQEPLTHRS